MTKISCLLRTDGWHFFIFFFIKEALIFGETTFKKMKEEEDEEKKAPLMGGLHGNGEGFECLRSM